MTYRYPQIFTKVIMEDRNIDPKIFEVLESVKFDKNEENALRICGQRSLLELGWHSPPKPTLTIISEAVEKLEKYTKLHFVTRTKQLMYKLTTDELSETLTLDEMLIMMIGH
jgi:hypothetical protein